MANRERGERTLVVNDQTYTLRLTTAAMVELEEACSTPQRELTFPEILQRVLKGSAKFITLFVWASLREHHPDLSVRDTQRLIDDAGGLVAFSAKVQEIAETTQPDEEDKRPQKAQADGAGGGSTSKRAKSA